MDIEIWKFLTLVSFSGVAVGFIMYHKMSSRLNALSEKHAIHNSILGSQEIDIIDSTSKVKTAAIDIAGLFILYRRITAKLDVIDTHLEISTSEITEDK